MKVIGDHILLIIIRFNITKVYVLPILVETNVYFSHASSSIGLKKNEIASLNL